MSGPDLDEGTALRIRRLELDNDDLRTENGRLKASIAQRQDEILRLGERLADLQAGGRPVRTLRMRLRPMNLLRAVRRRLHA